MLFAQGLPARLSQFVREEDNKADPPTLHKLANSVLQKAALRHYATAGASSGPAAAGGAAPRNDAMEIDAIAHEMCMANFGVTPDQATEYVSRPEGWAPHDTSQGSPGPSPASSSTSSTTDMAAILAAIRSLGAGKPQQRHGGAGAPRRTPSNGQTKDVPEGLAKARREASLCIRCGVAKYSPGKSGHNSSTCKATTDVTTSAAEGKARAGLDF
jgi:hypothetical protein